jgi:hypothetical protein
MASNPLTRDEVARLVLGAGTLDECAIAELALRRWVEQHPDDIAMQEAGEGLAMMQDALSGPDEPPAGVDLNELRTPRRAHAYSISFEDEVALVQDELGYDEPTAREFVLSYRPGPDCSSAPTTPALSLERDRPGNPASAAPSDRGAGTRRRGGREPASATSVRGRRSRN